MAEALRRLPAPKRLEQRDTVPMTYRQYTGVFAASIPRHVRLFMEKQLRNDKPDNIFTSSRAPNSKHVLPVSFLAVLPRYISRYNAPSAASLGAFATCYRSAIERLLIYISNTRGRRAKPIQEDGGLHENRRVQGFPSDDLAQVAPRHSR